MACLGEGGLACLEQLWAIEQPIGKKSVSHSAVRNQVPASGGNAGPRRYCGGHSLLASELPFASSELPFAIAGKGLALPEHSGHNPSPDVVLTQHHCVSATSIAPMEGANQHPLTRC